MLLQLTFCVTVKVTSAIKGKRKRKQKIDVCYFCHGKYTSQISKHYMAAHLDEQVVQNIVKMEIGSQERKWEMEKLRNKGNYEHNVNVRTFPFNLFSL